MSLRIVCGKSGSGKSTYCFDYMKSLAHKGERVYYMTPEQFSLESERRIAAELDQADMPGVEVDSFGRLARMIFSRFGPLYRKNIDDAGRVMIAERTLILLENKLQYFTDASEKADFVNEVIKTASEFTRRCVSYDDLMQAAEHIENPLSKMKIKDIALIYKTYCESLERLSGSKENEIELLCKKIRDNDFFRGAYFVIENFEGFTPQELSVIRVILSQVSEMTVSFVTDSVGGKSSGVDVFYESNKTILKLLDIAAEEGVEVTEPVYAGECKKYLNNPELAHLEQNYFKYPCTVYGNRTENLKLITGRNYYAEVEAIAQEIKRLTMNQGFRYRDIVIATRNSEVYFPIIRHVFGEYGIDCFVNSKTPAADHPLCRTVTAALNIITGNYPSKYVISYMKSEYSDIRDGRFELENYVLAAGIDHYKWKRDFSFVPYGFSEQDVEKYNELRKKLITPFESFFANFSGRKSAADITRALYGFLEQSGIKKRAEEQIAALTESGHAEAAKDAALAWKYIMQVSDGIFSAIGEEKIIFEKFCRIFKRGLESYSMIQPPLTVDRVQVCELDGYKSKNPRAFFLVGALDGVIPKGHLTEGVISDYERKILRSKGLDLANSTMENQINEQFILYSIITSAREKLYICLPSSDNEGAAVAPSSMIARLRKLFPNIKTIDNTFANEHDGDLQCERAVFKTMIEMLAKDGELNPKWKTVRKWFAENRPDKYQKAMDALNYTNTAHRLSEKSIDLLYGRTTQSSISKIEGYSRCRFAHFIQYGLSVRPRKEYDLQAVDLGSLMHEVIEKFSLHMEEYEGGWRALTKAYAGAKTAEITAGVVKEFLGDLSLGSTKFNRIASKIERIMSVTIWNIAEFYKSSDYEPFAYELEFGGEEIPPIEITLSDGRKVNLIGKVDRIDILKDAEKNYISIVDYKSSKKDFDYSKVAAGLQVQLSVYLSAICRSFSQKGEVHIPASMLYYTIDAPVIKAGGEPDEEEIRKKTAAELRMRGIILDDNRSLPELKASVAGKAEVSAENIDKLCSFTMQKLRDVLGEMMEGDISISPFRQGNNTACDYCEYRDICKFDPSVKGNKYRPVVKVEKEAFFSDGKKLD